MYLAVTEVYVCKMILCLPVVFIGGSVSRFVVSAPQGLLCCFGTICVTFILHKASSFHISSHEHLP
jgi:hypothetical protein